jgi:hypothetical protein
MRYNEFVKQQWANMPKGTGFDEGRKKINEMWKEQKGKGGAISNNADEKDGSDADGSGLFSTLLGAVGLGMEDDKNPMAKPVIGHSPAQGKGMSKAKKAKGKGKLQGQMEATQQLTPGATDAHGALGSGVLSELLGAVGLGMKDKEMKNKHKMLKNMIELEHEIHNKGVLTPARHKKLMELHMLHGQGFFGDLFSGIKNAAKSVVQKAIEDPSKIIEIGKQVAEHAPKVIKVVKGLRGGPAK